MYTPLKRSYVPQIRTGFIKYYAHLSITFLFSVELIICFHLANCITLSILHGICTQLNENIAGKENMIEMHV